MVSTVSATKTKPVADCYPKRFTDDGTGVEVDVHGCFVADALDTIRNVVALAHKRGRQNVSVIHGVSSSARSRSAVTIKGELERLVEEGMLDRWVSGARWSSDGGRCTLWIRIGEPEDERRIVVADILG